eukprot:7465082-Pyramimonas_sp.AAC.1
MAGADIRVDVIVHDSVDVSVDVGVGGQEGAVFSQSAIQGIREEAVGETFGRELSSSAANGLIKGLTDSSRPNESSNSPQVVGDTIVAFVSCLGGATPLRGCPRAVQVSHQTEAEVVVFAPPVPVPVPVPVQHPKERS